MREFEKSCEEISELVRYYAESNNIKIVELLHILEATKEHLIMQISIQKSIEKSEERMMHRVQMPGATQ